MRSRTKMSGYEKVGTKNNVADGVTKTVNQHVLRNMLTTLKIELLEPSKEQLSTDLIVCKNKLMGAEDSDVGSPGRQSKYWTQEHRDEYQENKNIVMDYRENCKNIVMEYQRKLQEHRDGVPRKQEHLMEYRENKTPCGLPRKLQQEAS